MLAATVASVGVPPEETLNTNGADWVVSISSYWKSMYSKSNFGPGDGLTATKSKPIV